jgi:nucleoside-diphosphate kinase
VERTLIILKPDAVQRGLIGELVGRFERRGLKIAAAKFMLTPRDLAERHYAEHEGKPFYEGLVSYITSSPVLVMAIEGKNAVVLCRQLIGSTRPHEAAPGTIRGDLAVDVGRNLVHGSDSPDSAARELALWFSDGEMVTWTRNNDGWIAE